MQVHKLCKFVQTYKFHVMNRQESIEQRSNKKQVFEPHSQKYFSKLLKLNSSHLFGFQTSHIMILYFIVQGLSVNQRVDMNIQQIVSYIKSLQLACGGYSPSSLYTNYSKAHKYNLPHLVFTYSAVNILKILGKLQESNKQKCLQSVKRCIKINGAISNFQNSNQADLRFVYAALAICNAFKDFTILDKQNIRRYLQMCKNYDGGYGLRPYCESHSGAIYCAVAAYKMLDIEIPNKSQVLQFLVNRQTTNQTQNIIGVQGRVGKLPDSCYTFWVGASIKILTGQSLLNQNIESFLKLCYNQESFNFSKYPKMKGDPLHTLHSSVGLRIINNDIQNIDIVQGTSGNA